MSQETRIEKLNEMKEDIKARISELNELSQKDLTIHSIDLDTASLDTPKIFAKYNNMYSDELMNFRSLIVQKNKIFLERTKWLMGKQNNKYYAEYGHQPEKILKTDCDMYIKADPIYTAIDEIVSLQKIYVDSLERICTEIKSRTFHIKNAIEWRRFTSGA